MPIRTDPWPTGTPCWADLAVSDVDAAKEFYAAVLGWTYSDRGAEYGHYQMCQRDGHSAAGIGPLQSADQPPAWTTYLASDAVDDTARKITENGGTLIAEPFDIPDSGRLCIALDPQGAAFGVWQASKDVGAEIYNEPGSLVWNEAAVPDPEADRQFYSAVFGYSYQPVEGAGSEYTTFHRGGDPLGGIGGLSDSPAEMPPHWMTYFMVADADTAVAAATELGATVLSGPLDTPYGRMATITDPQGATFSIMGVMSSD
ncbi:MAG: VOC family protein [Actinomycetota bacterium]|nr:VOC family protein [Actinomycetota bacterium]